MNNVDLQLTLQTYNHVRTHDRLAGTIQNNRGFGDTSLRTKINLWGNDGGPLALAVMPLVKLPTNQDGLGNNSIEGGLIVPLARELSHGWSMGFMTEVDVVPDALGGSYHPEFVNSVTFGHDIYGKLAGYIEFFSLINSQSGAKWIGTADFGFTYALTEDIQLDGGVSIGVTRSADDFNPFIGVSWRF